MPITGAHLDGHTSSYSPQGIVQPAGSSSECEE